MNADYEMLPTGDDMVCTKWMPKERNKNNKTKMAARRDGGIEELKIEIEERNRSELS